MSEPRLRKRHFLKALKETHAEGRVTTDLFAVTQKSLSTSSRNQPYLRLTLADQSDTIDAFVWDDAEEYGRQFGEGDIIEATFRIRVRNNVPQMHIESIRPLSAKDLEGIRWEDFRPGLDLDTRKGLWAEIEGILDRVQAPELAALGRTFREDDGFRDAFVDAAAAKGFHHAYVGGLAEHTLCVMRLAEQVADLYPGRLHRDLLVVGAFLHDIGKVEELSRKTGDYTDRGRLVGHIVLGAEMLRQRVSRIAGFPDSFLLQLEHLILSHHGLREYGSPVEPHTVEAIVLNFLDNLDAKLAGASQWLEKEQVAEGRWSGFWRGLGRSLYRTLTPGEGPEGAEPAGFGDLEQAFLGMADDDPSGGHDGQPARRPRAEPSRAAAPAKRAPPGQGDLGF
ncbi:MAG: HD domain-containing protein [Deferrisomatales bacterium]